MEIFIKPAIDSLQKYFGYDEWEEVDEDALLFQQGYDGYVIEVEDGETFEIPEDCEGEIIDEDETYFMNVEIFEDVFDKEEIEDSLLPGSYRLEGDLIIPEQDVD